MKISLSNNKKSGSGAGCLTIFGLCFLIPGLMVGFFALKNLYSNLQANSWEPVQASILSSDLKVIRGDDSTSYKATGKFSYSYRGSEYSSDKLFFGKGSDNIGSFHQDLIRNLNNAQNKGETLQAWVNPKKPSEAVLIKDIRWGMFGFMMIFPLIFGGAGAGIIFMGRYAKKAHAKEIEFQELYPQQPWMWKEEWQSHTIKSSNKTLLWFSTIFAAFWCLISTPILFIIPSEIIDKKNYLALIALLFPLVGIGLASWAIRNYFQWKKFGSSELKLQDLPARLGRTLRADLYIPSELPRNSECLVTVECVHKYTTGSGDNRKTVENILWQDQQTLTVSSASTNGHVLPIVFKLPKHQAESESGTGSDRYFWRLLAKSDLKGVDYSSNFEIPVFKSDSTLSDSESEYEEEFFAELEGDDVVIDKGEWMRLNLDHEQTVSGSKYIFKRARLIGMAFSLTLMTLIFGGIGIAMFITDKGSTLFGVIFTIAGFLLGWGALHQWLNKSEITVAYNKLSSRSGWFMTKQNDYQLGDVSKIYKHSSMSSGNVKYFGLYIDTPGKKKIKLAENLVGNRDVDSLIATVSEEFGLESKTASLT